MFIQSMLKDSGGLSLEVAALGLVVPGPSPGSSGGDGKRGGVEDSQRSFLCLRGRWLCVWCVGDSGTSPPLPCPPGFGSHGGILTWIRYFGASPSPDQTIPCPWGVPEKSSSAKPRLYKNPLVTQGLEQVHGLEDGKWGLEWIPSSSFSSSSAGMKVGTATGVVAMRTLLVAPN